MLYMLYILRRSSNPRGATGALLPARRATPLSVRAGKGRKACGKLGSQKSLGSLKEGDGQAHLRLLAQCKVVLVSKWPNFGTFGQFLFRPHGSSGSFVFLQHLHFEGERSPDIFKHGPIPRLDGGAVRPRKCFPFSLGPAGSMREFPPKSLAMKVKLLACRVSLVGTDGAGFWFFSFASATCIYIYIYVRRGLLVLPCMGSGSAS